MNTLSQILVEDMNMKNYRNIITFLGLILLVHSMYPRTTEQTALLATGTTAAVATDYLAFQQAVQRFYQTSAHS